jgi:hypothetical protein
MLRSFIEYARAKATGFWDDGGKFEDDDVDPYYEDAAELSTN